MAHKPPSLIPLAEALPRLMVNRSKGYDLVLSGRLEGERRGGRWYVSPESVQREIERRSTEPAR